MWEPLFLYRGNWDFFREPYLVPPFLFSFLIYASGCSRHHLLGCHGVVHPQLPRQGEKCASSLTQLK